MVGAALVVAEGTLKSVATVAVPLTTPLLGCVERLKPLDDWACQRLDAVEKMVPVITKPTGEVWLGRRWGSGAAGGDNSYSLIVS